MPRLDLATMATADFALTTIVGGTLLIVWMRNRAVQPLGCWGVAHLLMAAGIGLLAAGEVTSYLAPYQAGVTLIILGYAMVWTSARLFDGRRFRPSLLVAGPALWLAASLTLSLSRDLLALFALIVACYCSATAYEFWRGRGEQLIARWPAVALLAITAAGFLSAIPALAWLPQGAGWFVFAQHWPAAIVLVSLVGKAALAIIVVVMAKERMELGQRVETLTDPLTGLPNRRAFFRAAARRLRPREGVQEPVSVLVFDIDRFTLVNDRYGHGVGDRVLKLFAETLSNRLQASDVVGRISGEQFAAILPGTKLEDAAGAAERVRAAFEEAGRGMDEVRATVSAGVAAVTDGDYSLHELLARADHALHAAKERGRNRVEVAASGAMRSRRAGRGATAESNGGAPPIAPRIEFDLARARRSAAPGAK